MADRARALRVALGLAAAVFLATFAVFALGLFDAAWMTLAILVYAACLGLAIAVLAADRRAERWVTLAPAPPPQAPRPPEPRSHAGNGHAHPAVHVRSVRERVVYTTPRGEVIERVAAEGDRVQRTFTVAGPLGDEGLQGVARRIEARGWLPGRAPSEADLRLALARWGRFHEVSRWPS